MQCDRLKRREFLTFVVAATVWPSAGHAQQPAKIRRIGSLDYGAGMLPSGDFAPFHDTYRRRPFLEGLRELGWVRDKTLPSSGGLRRAKQIGFLHLPPNSLRSTSR
jgi:hypothetical protein